MHLKTTRTVLLLCATLALTTAYAHEATMHGTKTKTAAAKKDQTPWGIAGNPAAIVRTIAIDMSDTMRFTPSRIRVTQGETVRFVVRNSGKVLHEIVLGTKDALREHAALMRKFPGMEHDEPHMAHVKAGKRGDLVWNFNRAGEFDFACLIPGHYEAGMTGTITVGPSPTNR